MAAKVKLAGGPERTATWIWLDPDGRLMVEFYDFSETAQRMFGNDIAYTITVNEMPKLFSTAQKREESLIPWMSERFQSYFDIKRWLEEHRIMFSIERESWA